MSNNHAPAPMHGIQTQAQSEHSPLAVIHPFGSAPLVVPTDYRFTMEVSGSADALAMAYAGKDLVLVSSAELAARPGQIVVGIFAWAPAFRPCTSHIGAWRISNLEALGGGAFRLQKSITDGRWRALCSDGIGDAASIEHASFSTRDAAARAVRALLLART